MKLNLFSVMGIIAGLYAGYTGAAVPCFTALFVSIVMLFLSSLGEEERS